VRFLLDTLRVTGGKHQRALVFGWGAASLPCVLRFLMKRHDRRASVRASQSLRVAKPPVIIPTFATTPNHGQVARAETNGWSVGRLTDTVERVKT